MVTQVKTLCSKCGNPGEFRLGHKQCKACEKAYGRKRYQQNKEKWAAYREAHRDKCRKRNVENLRRKKAERQIAVGKIKSVPCKDCGRSFPPYVMDFDHRDPVAKKHNISYLLNKTLKPWAYIMEEISKCDVVCVNCHRLRTWREPKTHGTAQRLRLSLKKGQPCVDCGGFFHYCQMDFDHVRGKKIKPVSQCTSKKMILAEAAKCDLVCANCHRERNQRFPKGTVRLDPQTIDMQWKHQIEGEPQSEFTPLPERPIAFRPWHELVGTMLDVEVSCIGGVSPSAVHYYRNKTGIPVFRSDHG